MWTKEMFGTDKPIIGMVHLQPMPTDPKYDEEKGVEYVYECARKDLAALQDNGIDGVLFCNEFAIPYTKNVRGVTIATFSYVLGRLKKEIRVPFGITCASSSFASFDIAAATGASFVRAHYHGATAGVYGINDNDPGEVERHRVAVGCRNIKVMSAIVPEGTRQIAERSLKEVVKTLAFNVSPDGLLVYSTTPGSAVDVEQFKTVKEVTDTPVLASNGVKASTVAEILKYADGAIVGTGIKVDGYFYNPIDPKRVAELMENARKARGDV